MLGNFLEGSKISPLLIFINRDKTGPSFVKVKFNTPGRAVAVFFNHNFSNIFLVRQLVLFIFTVNKHHHISILFNGTGVAEVRQAWFTTTLFDSTRELRESNNWHFEFTSELFERAGDFGYLLN